MNQITAPLRRGQFLRREDGTWLVRLVDRTTRVLHLENVETGEYDRLDYEDWSSGHYHGTIEMVSDPAASLPISVQEVMYIPLSDLPPRMRYSAERKSFYLQAFNSPRRFYETYLPDIPHEERVLPRGKSKPIMDRFFQVVLPVFMTVYEEEYRILFRNILGGRLPPDFRKAPKFSTWCKWAKRDEIAGGNKRAQASRFDKRGPAMRKMNVRVENRLNELIDELYLTRDRFPIKDVWEELGYWVQDWNRRFPGYQLTCPSQRHIQRFVAETVDPYVRDCRRLGKDKADDIWQQVGQTIQPDNILDIVEVDHTPADTEVCDDLTGIRLGRPWITVALDRKSKCPIGIHIHFDGQTMAAIFQCLKNAMSPKDFLAQFEIDIDYPYPCGRPVAFLFDRGSDFDNVRTQQIGDSFDIRIDYAPVKCPEYKGSVERFLRTMQEDTVHPIPGSVPPWRKNEFRQYDNGDVCMTFSAFRWRVWYWITKVYVRSIHRTLGDTPLNVWQHCSSRYLHRPPPRRDDMENLLARPLFIRVTREGVAWDKLRWHGEPLRRIMTHPGFDPEKQITVRIDDNDVSRAWVTDPHTLQRAFLEPTDPEYMVGLTLYQHRMCKLMDKERRRAVEGAEGPNLLEAKHVLLEQARELINGGGRGRSIGAVARFMGVGARAPAGDDAAQEVDQVRDSPAGIDVADDPFDDLDALIPPDDAPHSQAQDHQGAQQMTVDDQHESVIAELQPHVDEIRELFIEFDSIAKTKRDIQRLIRRGNESSEGGVGVLTAPSRCGKTKLISSLMAETDGWDASNPIVGANGDRGRRKTCINATMPDAIGPAPGVVKDLSVRLLRAVTDGHNDGTGDKRSTIEDHIKYFATERETCLVIIDETHQAEAHAKAIAKKLKDFANLSRFSILLVGTEDTWTVVRANTELRNRVIGRWKIEPLDLRMKQGRADCLELLQTFDEHLEMTVFGRKSDLAGPRLAARIWLAGEGIIGLMATLIENAAMLALYEMVEGGERGITEKHLGEAFETCGFGDGRANPFRRASTSPVTKPILLLPSVTRPKLIGSRRAGHDRNFRP